MHRRAVVAGIGSLAIAPISFFPSLSSAQSECRLAPRDRAYTFTSDTVEWKMTIGRDQSCVRGIRYNDALIDGAQLATPPQAGKVTLQENAFHYQAAPDFQGADTFVISISGKRLGIRGTSTIRVIVNVQ